MPPEDYEVEAFSMDDDGAPRMLAIVSVVLAFLVLCGLIWWAL